MKIVMVPGHRAKKYFSVQYKPFRVDVRRIREMSEQVQQSVLEVMKDFLTMPGVGKAHMNPPKTLDIQWSEKWVEYTVKLQETQPEVYLMMQQVDCNYTVKLISSVNTVASTAAPRLQLSESVS